MTNARLSPSGPIISGNEVWNAFTTFTLQAGDTTVPGAYRARVGTPNPGPDNPIGTSPAVDADTFVFPKGKYLVNVFGRFGNGGTTDVVWGLYANSLNQWTWNSNDGTSDEWISRPAFLEITADDTPVYIGYTNLADSDPALFNGVVTIIRLSDV